MKLPVLTIDSGWHERRWCPIHTTLRLDTSLDLNQLSLWDQANNLALPLQAWRTKDDQVGLAWIVDGMAPHETRRYELRLMDNNSPPAPTSGVELIEKKPGELEIQLAGVYFATYNFGEQVIRPYLYPVLTHDGRGITRNWPMVEGTPGETTDHIHHKGIWTAHGEVNGVNNWGEGPGHGWQIHREFSRRFSGPVAGGFTEQLDWSDAGRKVTMTETRRLAFYLIPATIRLFDYEITLHASADEVTLADTKEAGLLSVRVASSMDAKGTQGGQIENAYGAIQEAETWGRRAPWCDYAGPVGGKWYGICLMDHETNPRHPTYWHVRDYGLMTANCFGLHDYTGDPEQRWDLVIPAGESLTWRYRVLIHQGDATAAKVAVHYHDFVHPPAVTFNQI